jgi:feruloyl esterase
MKRTLQRRTLIATAIGLAMATTACGGGDGASSDNTPAATPTALDCSTTALKTVALANATVDSAAPVAAGSYTPTGSGALPNLPAFCAVNGTATPTSDSIIHFQVWVPAGAAWNGKLVVTGNGGYSPQLSFGDMAMAMRQGYAVAGGDTGHQSANSNDMLFGVNHPEKIIDWGTRSVHAITDPSKAIVAALGTKAASQAYYYGCSTGGHQGYAEVQRYPNDFDGVIAGDPGNNRTALNAEFMWRFLANHAGNDNTTPILTTAKTTLITNSAIAACDALDGVTDGVIDDPRVCAPAKFNVDALLCSGADAATCLTAPQVAAAKKIYQGPVNPSTSTSIYPGPPVGSESGWSSYWGTTEPTRADFWRYWVFDNPDWNWWTFDFNRDYAYALAKVGGYVDQNNPDISAFKAHNGKLITYQGWADPVVSPYDTIAYYQKVVAAQGSQANTDAFFRLFMAPGMGHCGGGAGPANFGNNGQTAPVIDPQHDLISALDAWVTKGTAPDQIIASKTSGSTVVRTRPLCAYPTKAMYKGTGSTDDAANFTCS